MRKFDRRFFVRAAFLALLLPFAPAAAQQPVPDSTGHFVTVYGAKIYYVDRGAGPVVVLIHGLGDQSSVWKRSIDPLAATHRVIALDLIGFGRSDKPLLSYQPQTFVDFLGGFLAALHISRASLVGNSLGGQVAALYAIEHPAAVDHLALVDAGGYKLPPGAIAPRMQAALRLSTREDYRYFAQFTFYDKKFIPDDAFLDYAIGERVRRGDAYTINQLTESLLRNDDVLDGRLGAITAPTLIIWGRGDRLIPRSVAGRLNHDIRGSRLQVIEKCGHIPQVECPDDLNASLLQFLPSKGAMTIPPTPISTVTPTAQPGRTMTGRASGTFEVEVKPVPAYNTSPDAQVARMSIDKKFHGDLEGTSKGEMLTAGSYTKGSAGYVAIERVTGTLNGKKGSFTFQHTATMNRGAPSLSITIVPDSGTDDLVGITGTMNIIMDGGKHSYQFDYSLPGAS
jgi:Predicted hydrolases or acyltransferases (alpha/beta hydrolase superfamily)